MAELSRIITVLWCNNNAPEMMEHYLSIFPGSRTLRVSNWGADCPGPTDKILSVEFELLGQTFIGINAGPEFPYSDAFSLLVLCEDQAEIDYYWEKLLAGGTPSRCGWLKDKFGLSWQVTPRAMLTMMSDPDPERRGRVTRAMMQMVKLDLATLRAAFDSR